MKLFDPRAALAEIRKEWPTPATLAIFATQTPQNPPHVATVAGVAAPQRQIPKTAVEASQTQANDMRHGFTCNGHPKTWTGNIVSLDAWRGLSEWERHGPNRRMWDGRTKKWEDAK